MNSTHVDVSICFDVSLNTQDRDVVADEPIRVGLPFAIGQIQGCPAVTLESTLDGFTECQCRVTDRWADGSTKWVLVDFFTQAGQSEYRFHAENQSNPRSAAEPSEVAARSADIDDRAFIADDLLSSGGVSAPLTVTLKCVDENGALTWKRRDVCILEAGQFRTVHVQRIDIVGMQGARVLECDVEVHQFAGSSLQRWTVTVRNPRRAKHPGGTWDLGDPNSVLLRELSLAVRPNTDADAVSFSLHPGSAWQQGKLGTWIHQASSGGENWQSSNHVDCRGEVPLAFRGYQCDDGEQRSTGERATPSLYLEKDGAPLIGVSVPEFWQNFPKRIRATTSSIVLELFPREEYLHEIQPGEQKSHEFWIACDQDAGEGGLLDAMRTPATPTLQPSVHAHSQTIPKLAIWDAEPNGSYRELVELAVDSPHSFAEKCEIIDQYGWRNFGDVWGDHEAAFSDPFPPLISHWNNQYDLVYGLGINFLRSGDSRWFRLMDSMARHVRDIDIYHTDEDKSAYNHGLFWHTVHYVDAGRANHRSYPQGTVGGGPCAEHAYARGLYLHYCLTGETASRDAVKEMGDWVLAMEDSSKTPFHLLSREPTGLSSASGTPDYHGPGRGPGNACETLLTAFQATGERRYLTRVEELIRRVVHPQQNLEELDLLDAERRWYYTLFLQSLGRYLEYKVELSELDHNYAYGRATLIRFADWMAEHEYLYLEQPEKLEYPTETWAAQDMRKYEVFCYAADHVSGELQERFRERGEYFFANSVKQLIDSPTRHYCRPVALLLSNGYTHGWFCEHADMTDCARFPPGPEVRLPGPFRPFTPQKKIAKKRALAIASLSAALSVSAVVAGVLWWVWQ